MAGPTITAGVRVAGWGAAALLAASTAGWAWLLQTVDVPIIGLLVLTFVPTADLISLARKWLQKVTPEPETA